MVSNNYFFIGPAEFPITGQSVAFKYLKDIDLNEKHFFEFPTNRSVIENTIFLLRVLYFLGVMRPSLVYISLSRSNLGFVRDAWLIWFSHIFGSKIIGHLHGADLALFIENSGALKTIIISTYSRLHNIVILTEGMRDQLKYIPKLRWSVISNAVPDSLYDLGNNNDAVFTYTYMSNLIPEKGLESFMIAFAEQYGYSPRHQLLICGKMGFDARLDSLVIKYCREFGNIKYYGIVSGFEKINVLRQTDCIVLLSSYKTEAQPICVLESFAIGAPVIVLSHNYIKEIVNFNNGYICENLEMNRIMEACKTIETNYERYRSFVIVDRFKYKVAEHLGAIKNLIQSL